MKRHLDVAVGIADAIAHAHRRRAPLDVAAETRILARNLCVAMSCEEIADVLRSEGREAGIELIDAPTRH
ncbi:hypothetical protein [Antarcticirhabdus aurantiaca]|uniref:Uncharacterized protein n=1 Tax=Antarcticirhabdus aurantiaca TaxID=2606717 RepID=A0ACD4NQV3_9HYPH|nr:hypothetical protein [Antarcticirhabdus aurantiaca]WAJ29250.1 hypothetical protein OXU80_03155 [Jeongeuplla avenae]